MGDLRSAFLPEGFLMKKKMKMLAQNIMRKVLRNNFSRFKKERGWPLIIQFVIFELRGYWYIDMLEMAQNRFEALPQVQD